MQVKRPLVYAVITHWNSYDDTAECVKTLLQSDYSNLKSIIVDNGSTDNSPTRLAQEYPAIPQVHTGHNGAITFAYNKGMEYSLDHDAAYILMLNNDIAIDPQMVSLLVDKAESDSEIGVVTPKIYYYDQPQTIWFAGGYRSRFDFGSYDTYEGDLDTPANSVEKEVDYAWACGMLMRRSLLEEIGLFDTQFFLYYDDVDISIRTQQAGYKIWYVPQAKMWHKVSHSTGSAHFTRIWARSKMRLYRKHSRGLHKTMLILYAFLHGGFRALIPRQDNMRMRTHTIAYMRGLLSGLKSLDEPDSAW